MENKLKINLLNLSFITIKLLVTFLLISLIILLLGGSPLEVMESIIYGAFGKPQKIVKTLLIWAPIALASLALLITFSAGLWNIGIEGQIIAGSIGATIIARSALGESIASPYIQIFIGLIFGGLWGLLCGFLRVKFNVHEIFGGLGLDFVASGLIVYLIIGPWKRAGIASTSGTDIFPDASWFPTLGKYNFQIIPLILVIASFFIIFILIKYTNLGLRLRATGINPSSTSRYKINSSLYFYYAFAIAGALAGIAGVVQAAGFHHKLVPAISGGYGFLSILIVLASSRNPVITMILSFFFASMIAGGSQLQLRLDLHSSMISIILSSIVLIWLVMRSPYLNNIFNKITSRLNLEK